MDNNKKIPVEFEKGIGESSSICIVQEIIDHIEENILEEITPKNIAANFYHSISVINNLFKIVCKMTMMEYVRNRRLSLAGQELMISKIHIIDLAFKYGYETPEAFAKAFSRFHGFPPSFVRRVYPETKKFYPIKINLEISGGWVDKTQSEKTMLLTKQNAFEQESNLLYCYDKAIKNKGETNMENLKYQYRINVKEMKEKEDWRILQSLTKKLDLAGIKFKVDGKTMIFAHGLEFKLEKICLTFKWSEEQRIIDFFGYNGLGEESFKGFKYFDTAFEGMKIRCMFYAKCPNEVTDELIFNNTDPVNVDGQIINVQSLEFYHENAQPDAIYYKMVDDFLKKRIIQS